MARVLFISAHPDDETLGAGGTIKKQVAQGDEVFWVVATAAYEPRWTSDVIATKRAEVEAVAQFYGMKDFTVLGLPATRLDDLELGEIIAPVGDAIRAIRPDTLYTVGPYDVHTDHQALFKAVWTCIKPFRSAQDGLRRVLTLETLSSTDAAPPLGSRFVPNAWVDITGFLDAKLAAMDLFASEAQSELLPRGPSAIEALARFRGAQIGVQHAEAFQLLRDIG